MTVDGTYFTINETTPFSPRWYSHNFRNAYLRYKVGITVNGGNIFWAYGPFPCGPFIDLRIFRLNLRKMLLSNEKMIADQYCCD